MASLPSPKDYPPLPDRHPLPDTTITIDELFAEQDAQLLESYTPHGVSYKEMVEFTNKIKARQKPELTLDLAGLRSGQLGKLKTKNGQAPSSSGGGVPYTASKIAKKAYGDGNPEYKGNPKEKMRRLHSPLAKNPRPHTTAMTRSRGRSEPRKATGDAPIFLAVRRVIAEPFHRHLIIISSLLTPSPTTPSRP